MKKAKASIFEKTSAEKVFTKAMESLSYTQSGWTVFNDFLDFSLLMLKWWDLKPEYFTDLEKKYPKKEQHELFAEAYMAIGMIAEGNKGEDENGLPLPPKGFIDPFGNYFMENFSNERTGQFFTPEHICDMMALMTIGDLEEGKTVCDPCCGSGRFLLSAAKINRKFKFYAADIDLTCVKMTLINFMLNSMAGEVAHCDSLKTEVWKSYRVSLIPHEEYLLPMYVEQHPTHSAFYGSFASSDDPKPAAGGAAPKKHKPFTKTPAGQATQMGLFD